MSKEAATIETLKKPDETQENSKVSQSVESRREEVRTKMTNEAKKETANLAEECAGDPLFVKNQEDAGAIIDPEDKSELEGTAQKADVAKIELIAEIGEKNEKADIIGIAEDRNFEGSIIIKTKNPKGGIVGYAIRKNSKGDLEGNEIGYMDDGSAGPVYQLHQSDFTKLEQQGILESYKNELAKKDEDLKKEQLRKAEDFSKEYSKEDRSRVAKELLERRKKYFKDKKKIETNEQEQKITEQLEELGNRIESNKSGALLKEEYLKETKEIIGNFCSNENKKWLESKEEIEKNFSEENLASLSLEDYVKLLQKFPGHLVTHVTRQGVRSPEQSFAYHNKDVNQFKNSFKDMLESKRLISPLAVAVSESKSYHDICRFLNGNENIITYRDSINDLNADVTDIRKLMKFLERLTFDKKEGYHDKSAVHLGIERVLNAMYGGEKGNDIFIIYPAAHIVSQYNFLNKHFEYGEKNLTSPRDAFNNDLYVWNKNESEGMNIDAGIVFVPENVQVDRNSGSQYVFEKNEDRSGRFEKAEDVIKSREYWDKYFFENPEKKPSKIIYYDATMTPTEALNDWKLKNHINDNNIGARDIGVGIGAIDNTRGRLDTIGTRTDEIGFGENKVERSNFKRLNGDEEAMHFHRLALEAMRNEYSLDQLLAAYDPNFFSRPKSEWDEIINKLYDAQRIDI